MAQDGIQVRIGVDGNGQRYATIAIVRSDGKVTYVRALHSPGKDFPAELQKAVEKAEKYRVSGDAKDLED